MYRGERESMSSMRSSLAPTDVRSTDPQPYISRINVRLSVNTPTGRLRPMGGPAARPGSQSQAGKKSGISGSLFIGENRDGEREREKGLNPSLWYAQGRIEGRGGGQ